MIDLGGAASGIGLIPRRITLKDNEFNQFIQNISLSKTTMGKDQDLVSLTLSILDNPPKHYRLDKDGVFKEAQEQINTLEEFFKLCSDPKGLEILWQIVNKIYRKIDFRRTVCVRFDF